jgi:hypothetical protein
MSAVVSVRLGQTFGRWHRGDQPEKHRGERFLESVLVHRRHHQRGCRPKERLPSDIIERLTNLEDSDGLLGQPDNQLSRLGKRVQ